MSFLSRQNPPTHMLWCSKFKQGGPPCLRYARGNTDNYYRVKMNVVELPLLEWSWRRKIHSNHLAINFVLQLMNAEISTSTLLHNNVHYITYAHATASKVRHIFRAVLQVAIYTLTIMRSHSSDGIHRRHSEEVGQGWHLCNWVTDWSLNMYEYSSFDVGYKPGLVYSLPHCGQVCRSLTSDYVTPCIF